MIIPDVYIANSGCVRVERVLQSLIKDFDIPEFDKDCGTECNNDADCQSVVDPTCGSIHSEL